MAYFEARTVNGNTIESGDKWHIPDDMLVIDHDLVHDLITHMEKWKEQNPGHGLWSGRYNPSWIFQAFAEYVKPLQSKIDELQKENGKLKQRSLKPGTVSEK